MQKHHRWLLEELRKWRSEGLIDESVQAALVHRYPVVERAWGKMIFSAIGAVLAGLGVILFFAYNWDDLPKYAKLGLVFTALIASHSAAVWLSRQNRSEHRVLAESLHVLGTMMFGAGIWLIAQVYHIDEHYPNAILVWSLGALTLAWALPSLAHGFLAVALIALWSGFETIDFRWVNHWAPALMAAGIVPLAWLQRSQVLLFMGLLGFLAVSMLAVIPVEAELSATLPFFVGAAYISAGLMVAATAFPASHRTFKTLGFISYLAMLYVFSFADATELFGDLTLSSATAVVYFGVPMLVAAALWAWQLFGAHRKLDDLWRWHWCLIGGAVALVTALSLGAPLFDWYAAVPFNLLFLGHCLVFVLQGSRDSNAKLVGAACSLFALLVITRYVDLFESLLLRSLVFVLLGVCLFVVGNFYSRSKRAGESAPS